MHWQRSGELIMMVRLGGTGTLYGSIGALAPVAGGGPPASRALKVILGPLLVAGVVRLGGIAGAIERWRPAS
jgi:hypothetical protein